MLSLFTTLFVASWNRAHYFPGGDPRLYSLYVGRVHRGSDIFFLSDNEVCLFVGHPCFFFPSRGQQQFQNDLIINLGKGSSPGSWLWKLERYLSYPTVPSQILLSRQQWDHQWLTQCWIWIQSPTKHHFVILTPVIPQIVESIPCNIFLLCRDNFNNLSNMEIQCWRRKKYLMVGWGCEVGESI